MMDFNKLANTEELAEQTDSVGGRYFFPSDIYDAIISCIYLQQAKSGAMAAVVDFKIDGKDYRETMYFTNKNGENFYTAKDGTKQGLPSWNLLDAMSTLSIGKGFMAALGSREEKVVKVYNYDAKQELPTNVPVIMDLIGAKIKLGIIHKIVNKREQTASGEWIEVDDTKEENELSAVFHPDTLKTFAETKKNADAKFHETWLAKYKTGAPYDRSKKTGNAPSVSGTREVKKVDRTALFGA